MKSPALLAALLLLMLSPFASADELVGTWVTEDRLADGRRASNTVEFKADWTFTSTVTVGRTRIHVASGAWERTDGVLHWTYIHSVPELPADQREDKDQVLSLAGDRLKLKSSVSGKERVYKRQR